MEHAFQWRGVPDGTLISFPSYLKFKPRSSPWASRPPAQLLPFALTPVKPSWHFLFSCLPQGLCPSYAFYQECSPQVLAWLASSLIHISAIKTISLIDLNTTAASNQPSLPHLEWFLHSSAPLDIILFVFICVHQWNESSPRAVICQAEVIPTAPD